jgi:hypothetical protein
MEITNYTHYSTDDLKSLINLIEKRADFVAWRTDSAFVFTEFDPKNPYIHDRSYRWNKNAPKTKRYVAKMRWAALSSIGLLVPRKIYENPLEALVQDDIALAPEGMVVQILATLLDRCSIGSYGHQYTGANVPSLRVLENVETKRPKSDPKKIEGERKVYIKRNLRGFAYDARRAGRELTKGYNKQVKAAAFHLKAEKDRLASVDAAFNDAVTALAQLEAAINVIESGV